MNIVIDNTPWCKPWEAISMSLDPLLKLDAVKVTGSSKTFPVRSFIQASQTSINKRGFLLRVLNEKKVKPLKMSFWPRGRTLVWGKRRDLRSSMVELGEIEMGIETPLNFTFMVMVSFELGSVTLQSGSISQFSVILIRILLLWMLEKEHVLGKENHSPNSMRSVGEFNNRFWRHTRDYF